MNTDQGFEAQQRWKALLINADLKAELHPLQVLYSMKEWSEPRTAAFLCALNISTGTEKETLGALMEMYEAAFYCFRKVEAVVLLEEFNEFLEALPPDQDPEEAVFEMYLNMCPESDRRVLLECMSARAMGRNALRILPLDLASLFKRPVNSMVVV